MREKKKLELRRRLESEILILKKIVHENFSDAFLNFKRTSTKSGIFLELIQEKN